MSDDQSKFDDYEKDIRNFLDAVDVGDNEYLKKKKKAAEDAINELKTQYLQLVNPLDGPIPNGCHNPDRPVDNPNG